MIAAALREQGAEVPEDVSQTAADVLWPCSEPYAEAFHALSRCRGSGMAGPHPIAYTDIEVFARSHGFANTVEHLDEFAYLIYAQDSAFRLHFAPQAKG